MSILDTIEAERNKRISMYTSEEDSSPEIPRSPKEKRVSIVDFIRRHGEEGVRKLTGFSVSEIDELLDIILPSITEEGAGRKGPDPRSLLFSFISWVSTGFTYGKLATLLECTESALFRAVNYVYIRVKDTLVNALVPRKMRLGSRVFQHFPDAKLIVDATLFEINRPSNRDEARLYLSGKHRRYGTKIQVLVNTDGICVHMSKLFPGSFHDKRIWDESGAEAFCRLPPDPEQPGVIRHHQLLADGGY